MNSEHNNKTFQDNSKSFVSQSINGCDYTTKKSHHRPYLPPKLWESANAQKRMWLKAVSEEFGIKKNEYAILESLVYLTDENGCGIPSIATIADNVKGSCHYKTAQSILKKLESLKIIKITRRGKQLSNVYDLIGFNFKLSTCYPESSTNLTLSFFPKKKKRKRVVNKYNETSSPPHKPSLRREAATVCGDERPKREYIKPIPAQSLWVPPPERDDCVFGDAAKSKIEEARRVLWDDTPKYQGDKQSSLSGDYTQDERHSAILEFERVGMCESSLTEAMILARMRSNRMKMAN